MRDALGTRRLEASLTEAGDLLIEGHDLGKGVEEFFGYREYEWDWTVRAGDIPALLTALGEDSDVLTALSRRFSGDQAAGLLSFLEEHGVPHESWSRTGD
jgi:hypothetical protein